MCFSFACFPQKPFHIYNCFLTLNNNPRYCNYLSYSNPVNKYLLNTGCPLLLLLEPTWVVCALHCGREDTYREERTNVLNIIQAQTLFIALSSGIYLALLLCSPSRIFVQRHFLSGYCKVSVVAYFQQNQLSANSEQVGGLAL